MTRSKVIEKEATLLAKQVLRAGGSKRHSSSFHTEHQTYEHPNRFFVLFGGVYEHLVFFWGVGANMLFSSLLVWCLRQARLGVLRRLGEADGLLGLGLVVADPRAPRLAVLADLVEALGARVQPVLRAKDLDLLHRLVLGLGSRLGRGCGLLLDLLGGLLLLLRLRRRRCDGSR